MKSSEFEAIVDQALESLPGWVFEMVDNLHVIVEEEPPPELGEVLGVYEGVALPDRAADYFGALPDRIVIFRQPHLRMGLTDDDLSSEIRRTVLHEVAHHVGIDDQRLHELGWD